jgi:hypothetical protein
MQQANANRDGGVPEQIGSTEGLEITWPRLRSTTFERQATGLSDPDPAEGLTASAGILALRCCKSDADETPQQPAREAVGEHHSFAGTERAAHK